MRRLFPSLLFLPALVVVAFAFSPKANAAAQRTFVASYGSSTNTVFNCSITKPCRAFSEAIGVTNPKGEVVVLDSAGYGPVEITQSVSVIAPPGIYAGISVFSGAGITISGNGIDVVLRGLTINGQGGSDGIYHSGTAGSLVVDNCNISGMTQNGILAGGANSRISVRGAVVLRSGLSALQVNGAVTAAAHDVYFGGNASSAGVIATNGALVTITDSALVDHADGVSVSSGIGSSDVMVSHTAISGSTNAFVITAIPGTSSRLVADANSINNISDVVFKFLNSGGPITIYSPGNNTIGFNNGYTSGGSLTTPCCLQ